MIPHSTGTKGVVPATSLLAGLWPISRTVFDDFFIHFQVLDLYVCIDCIGLEVMNKMIKRVGDNQHPKVQP